MSDRTVIKESVSGALAKHGITDVLGALACDSGRPVVASRTSFVRQLELADAPHRSAYLKVYFFPDAGKRLGYAVKKSRARREYENLEFLRSRGMHCPEPLAWGERRTLWNSLECAFVVTAGIDGAMDLAKAVPLRARDHSEAGIGFRRTALAALGLMVGNMHRAGFVDGDLHWRNILLVDRDGGPEFAFIDSPRGGRARSSSEWYRGVVDDLAALDKHGPEHFSKSDRLRFMKGWTDGLEITSRVRHMIHDVGRRVAEMRLRHERKERRHASESPAVDAAKRRAAERMRAKLLANRS